MSELIWAAKNGDLDQVKELVEKDSLDVNTLVDGRLLLVEAADYNQYEVIQYLVDKGANVNAADPRGITPLLAAIYEGHTRCVAYLLSKGASPKGEALDGKSYLETAEKEEIRGLLRDQINVLWKEEKARKVKEYDEFVAYHHEYNRYEEQVLMASVIAASVPSFYGLGVILKNHKAFLFPKRPKMSPALANKMSMSNETDSDDSDSE